MYFLPEVLVHNKNKPTTNQQTLLPSKKTHKKNPKQPNNKNKKKNPPNQNQTKENNKTTEAVLG